jgi:hypothetical protein
MEPIVSHKYYALKITVSHRKQVSNFSDKNYKKKGALCDKTRI